MVRIRTDPDGSGMGLEVLKTSTNGYADVRVGARDTAATESETTYKFDGKQYRESKTMLVHSKPERPSLRLVEFNSNVAHRGYDNRSSFDRPARYTPDRRSYRTSDDAQI